MFRPLRWTAAAFVLSAAALFTAVSAYAVNPSFFPADTEIIVSINFKQIVGSKLFKNQKGIVERLKKEVENNFPGGDQAQKYLEQAGIDVYKDIHSFSFGMPPVKDPEAGFFVVEGKFDPEKFHDTAKKASLDNQALSVRKSGTVTVLEISPPGEKRFFVALVSNKALIGCATKKGLNEGLARATGIKRSTFNKEMTGLLKDMSAKQSISFAVTGNAIRKLSEGKQIGGGQFGPGPDDIKGIIGSVTVSDTLRFRVGLNMTDAQTAQQTTQGLQFGLKFFQGMLADQAQNNAKVQPALDVVNTIQINSEGGTMFVQGSVPPETLKSLLKQLDKEF